MVATSGEVNGQPWFLAPSLVLFMKSVDLNFPNRDKSSDGSIGDAAHAARQSDHNPCWDCAGYLHGIVRAIDVDIDGREPGRDLRTEILNAAIGHPAVWYVISNGKIYSRTYDWRANDYKGTNGHFHHVHISINYDIASAKSATLLLKERRVPDMATLDKDDLTAIEGIVQRYSAFNAENLRQRIDDIANAARAAVDPDIDAGIAEVEALIRSLKLEVGLLPPAT